MGPHQNFFDEFYAETMTEMAESFFARRKELEVRQEAFTRLALQVRDLGGKALRRWGSFFALLADAGVSRAFCEAAGLRACELPALAAGAGDPCRYRFPLALTARGRYEKAVRYAYEAMRLATRDYMEGGYGQDPRNPAKKILLPNHASLKRMAEAINAEVDKVNTCQTPSTVLAYAKSLDPVSAGREAVAGGFTGENVCKIDEDMAFKPVDFDALGLPELPVPPETEAVRPALDAACDAAWSGHREAAVRALACLTRG
ncbi:hypothetical protein NNJEOMEG_03595 [Fundidesulfovibrio magnetotacticus]|uniref:Uncharacterized protein n=1 Tax=Fundidesulfovibrio magnetotacticus TaxID=2730080 RepID=A0A6V8M1K5_9BACT|nr:hypothetical protein [Fundidesulfovibrio magnetotacticus]GFK95727.1 hypothetical protein NNJEOMEG_03595 [Fundidesulfovibrio magnetotacticus]